MNVDLSIIVPCYNEEQNIPRLWSEIEKAMKDAEVTWEVVLVDDGSKDNTAGLIKELAKKDSRVKCVFHETNRGIVAGWKSGLLASTGRLVVTIDADLQYLPSDILKLLAIQKESGADLVQGWRRFSPRVPFWRRVVSKALSWILNISFGLKLRDAKSGFVLYKREVFEDILNYRYPYREFQHFITASAKAKGYKIEQVPVEFVERIAGESFIKRPIRFILRVILDMPWAIREFRLTNYIRKN